MVQKASHSTRVKLGMARASSHGDIVIGMVGRGSGCVAALQAGSRAHELARFNAFSHQNQRFVSQSAHLYIYNLSQLVKLSKYIYIIIYSSMVLTRQCMHAHPLRLKRFSCTAIQIIASTVDTTVTSNRTNLYLYNLYLYLVFVSVSGFVCVSVPTCFCICI